MLYNYSFDIRSNVNFCKNMFNSPMLLTGSFVANVKSKNLKKLFTYLMALKYTCIQLKYSQ